MLSPCLQILLCLLASLLTLSTEHIPAKWMDTELPQQIGKHKLIMQAASLILSTYMYTLIFCQIVNF